MKGDTAMANTNTNNNGGLTGLYGTRNAGVDYDLNLGGAARQAGLAAQASPQLQPLTPAGQNLDAAQQNQQVTSQILSNQVGVEQALAQRRQMAAQAAAEQTRLNQGQQQLNQQGQYQRAQLGLEGQRLQNEGAYQQGQLGLEDARVQNEGAYQQGQLTQNNTRLGLEQQEQAFQQQLAGAQFKQQAANEAAQRDIQNRQLGLEGSKLLYEYGPGASAKMAESQWIAARPNPKASLYVRNPRQYQADLAEWQANRPVGVSIPTEDSIKTQIGPYLRPGVTGQTPDAPAVPQPTTVTYGATMGGPGATHWSNWNKPLPSDDQNTTETQGGFPLE